MAANMKTPIGNFSDVRVDAQGREYVVHKPTGTVYLLRKPDEQIALIHKQTTPKPKQARPLFPNLAQARFIQGSAPQPKEKRRADDK